MNVRRESPDRGLESGLGSDDAFGQFLLARLWRGIEVLLDGLVGEAGECELAVRDLLAERALPAGIAVCLAQTA